MTNGVMTVTAAWAIGKIPLPNNTDGCCEKSMMCLVEEQLHSGASACRYFTLDLGDVPGDGRKSVPVGISKAHKWRSAWYFLFYLAWFKKRDVSFGSQFFLVIYGQPRKRTFISDLLEFNHPHVASMGLLCKGKE
jgi:hypothetical protein